MTATTEATTPATPPQPKFLDRPMVREAIRIGIAVLLAYLAGKGIKLPGEGLPQFPAAQPVVVYVGPGHEAAKQ